MKKIFFLITLLLECYIQTNDLKNFSPISLDPIEQKWNMLTVELTKHINGISHESRQFLKTCPCIDLPTRINFARETIREIMIRHSRTKSLNYVSFACGALLQDYIIIMGLYMMDYTVIPHFIDIFYTREISKMIFNAFKKELNSFMPNLIMKQYSHAQEYFQSPYQTPDIIIFADPDMNKLTPYDSAISDSGIIDFPDLKMRILIRKNEKIVSALYEKAEKIQETKAADFCKDINGYSTIETAIQYAIQKNIAHIATNHQFLSFDEFIRAHTFNEANPLIALIHKPFKTALTDNTSTASAYLMTRQDYLQYDYTLQALYMPGYKQITD